MSIENKLDQVRSLLEAEVAEDRLMGAAVQVSQGDRVYEPVVAGRRRLDYPSVRVEPDTIFLVASITKPIACAAVVKLIEEGRLSVDDTVATHLPAFAANGKADVRILHLLTHTSGLPDQIPENAAYREAHQPLSDFVDRICELPIAFEPGTRISYQSAGIAVLGALCESLTGQPLPAYLKTSFFDPLGLDDTSLGVTERSDRESDVKIAGEGLAHGGGGGTDYDWNSDYWRAFGAPWGGMLTTVSDLTRLLRAFLRGGELDGVRILSADSVADMVRDHSSGLPGMSAEDAAKQRWGLGWRLSGPGATVYGSRVSDATFGHGGATGTLAWADPESDTTCVIFTNDPEAAGNLRGRISDVVGG